MSAVTTTRDGAIAGIRLNYGEAGFTAEHGSALAALWRDLRADARLDAIVVSAEGDFCPGGVTDLDDAWFPAAHDCWIPVILAVQCRCAGPGLVLAGQADVIVAAESATFSLGDWETLPFRQVAWLQNALPYGELARLAMLGAEGLSAQRAADLGIVSRIVVSPNLTAAAMAEARILSGLSRPAVRATKEALQRGRNLYVRDAARLGQAVAARLP